MSFEAPDWLTAPRIYVENLRDRDPAYHVSAEAVLNCLGDACHLAELTCRFSDERDIAAFQRADVLIAGRLDTGLIARDARNLKLIQCTSAGVESYAPFDWLRPTVTLTNASGVHSAKAGEFGLMAALMLHERVPSIATNQRNRVWDRRLRGLAVGRRVLIYGVGALGGAVAERLCSFGFDVSGIRRSGQPHRAVSHMTTPDHFHGVLPNVDILVLACPLTNETRGLIDARALELLPKGASLLNIARGEVVDHVALASALKRGHLAGAILDVFEEEPLPAESSFWEVPNLMVFPHVSADAPDGYVNRCLAILAENLSRLRSGREPRNRVDPVRGY